MAAGSHRRLHDCAVTKDNGDVPEHYDCPGRPRRRRATASMRATGASSSTSSRHCRQPTRCRAKSSSSAASNPLSRYTAVSMTRRQTMFTSSCPLRTFATGLALTFSASRGASSLAGRSDLRENFYYLRTEIVDVGCCSGEPSPQRRQISTAAPPPGVPGLPQAAGQGLPAAEVASGRGQLRDPQARGRHGVAGAQPRP